MARWGISATILAPRLDILRFAAHHLELGAHRLYLYLDDPASDAYTPLKNHPKIRVQQCDSAYWKRLMGQRPDRHQVRQTLNATHAYTRRHDLDWLMHLDVDEFLVPERPVSNLLDHVPGRTNVVRARPMELLGGSLDAFKAFIPAGPKRQKTVRQLYPTFGRHLKGGFISHVAGKVFVRTGLPDITVQIHDAFQNGARIAADEMPTLTLAHCHARSWLAWRAAFAYRLQKGSYRAELKPVKGARSLHDLLSSIFAEEGAAGLRVFYDEVIGDSPDLRARLDANGLLRVVPLSLDEHMHKHFGPATV